MSTLEAQSTPEHLTLPAPDAPPADPANGWLAPAAGLNAYPHLVPPPKAAMTAAIEGLTARTQDFAAIVYGPRETEDSGATYITVATAGVVGEAAAVGFGISAPEVLRFFQELPVGSRFYLGEMLRRSAANRHARHPEVPASTGVIDAVLKQPEPGLETATPRNAFVVMQDSKEPLGQTALSLAFRIESPRQFGFLTAATLVTDMQDEVVALAREYPITISYLFARLFPSIISVEKLRIIDAIEPSPLMDISEIVAKRTAARRADERPRFGARTTRTW